MKIPVMITSTARSMYKAFLARPEEKENIYGRIIQIFTCFYLMLLFAYYCQNYIPPRPLLRLSVRLVIVEVNDKCNRGKICHENFNGAPFLSPFSVAGDCPFS